MSNNLFVFGVDYKSSDLGIRERMAFAKGDIPLVLSKLRNLGIVAEVVILSTCNRTEIYCVGRDIDLVVNTIGEIKNLCPKTIIRKYCYIYDGCHAVSHLFRVISGLESMVLGESEIVAQVKEAFSLSKEHKMVGRNLSGIFQMALSVEKDVRNATAINHVAVSMGKAIANLVAVNYANLLDISNESCGNGLLFIGAGDMMRTLIPHFKNTVARNKAVVNRTVSKAMELSQGINGNYYGLSELPKIINNYSVIIACCSSDSPIIDYKVLGNSIARNQEVLIIDLSVPLVTDVNLKNYDNITVITVDDIAKIVDVGIEKRKYLASFAEDIIKAKIEEYKKWEKKRGLSPVIRALREQAENTRMLVLNEAKRQVLNGADIEGILQELSTKLTNKLLHLPTVNICSAEGLVQNDLINLISYLYNLDINDEGIS